MDTPPPGTGTPVLSSPATVPSQMPLRGPESHSERFLDVSQYETHTSPLEALYGPYSTSAPARCTARSIETKHSTTRSPNSPRQPLSSPSGGCDLNSVNEIEITPHEAVFDSEGNRLLPTTGPGEGVRPPAPAREVGRPRPRTDFPAGNQRYGVVNEPCSGPVGPLLLDLLSINKYRSDPCYGQAPALL